MNAVGREGEGESVWLGWFLYFNLMGFARVCERCGDRAKADELRARASTLQSSIEEHGWDGAWYRRAFFDDGSLLGSIGNAECKIDAIAQAWGVIAGAAPPEHRRAALQAVEERLVRDKDQLMLLLEPPFDHSSPSPGYIQGYVRGIRENGGHYAHGAIWVALAYILEGDGDSAYRLLQMLNPIRHADSPERIQRYKVEPYVVAGDIYSNPSHTGRGGWTWYTGSAGWMYRTAVEGLLGLKLRGTQFVVDPCIPRGWKKYQITFCDGDTSYVIEVENPHGVSRGVQATALDGAKQSRNEITRIRDGRLHLVRVVMG